MEVSKPSGEMEQEKVVEFMEIVGDSAERARQYLEATGWQLEEAVQLYFADSHEGGVSTEPTAPTAPAATPPPGPSVTGTPGPPSYTESPSFTDRECANDDYVRPPLPVKREALYEDILQYRAHRVAQMPTQPSSVDAFRNFEDEANQRSGFVSGEASSQSPGAGSGLRDSLAALYRPPFVLMFQGTFEQAKTEAARQRKWLLVNLQSTKEFSSYMLNRDTWAHEAVKDTVGTSFVFWQIYDDTEEGRKVCTYYKLVNMPTILVLDPLTGQKMRSWEGMISAERLLEDLVRYMDMGPMEGKPIGFPPQKRPRESTNETSDSSKDMGQILDDEDEELRRAMAASLEDASPLLLNSRPSESLNQETESSSDEQPRVDTIVAEVPKPTAYPELPDEPPESRDPTVCRVGIRFPTGGRGQRRFLKTDPIKFLWSFCSSQVKEAVEGRRFHLNQTIPGATCTLDYSSGASMQEAGVANSMLLMTWD